MVVQNDKLIPMITELEEQDTVHETKIQTLNNEIMEKDTQIKSLTQQISNLKISNKELISVSKNKMAPKKQVVLLKTDDRLVRKD